MPLFITSVTRAPRYRPRPISFPQIAAHLYPSNVWDQGWEPVRDLEILSIRFFSLSFSLSPLIFLLIQNIPLSFSFLFLSLSFSVPPSIFLCLSFSLLDPGLRKKWLICKDGWRKILFSVCYGEGGRYFYEVRIQQEGYNGVIRIKVWSRGQVRKLWLYAKSWWLCCSRGCNVISLFSLLFLLSALCSLFLNYWINLWLGWFVNSQQIFFPFLQPKETMIFYKLRIS